MFDLLGGKLPEDIKPSPVGAADQFIKNYELDIRSYLTWRNQDISHVGASHPLVRLLYLMGQKVGYDLSRTVEDIYRRVAFLTPDLARTFGFTTISDSGKLHTGDSGNTTIYLVGESPFRASVTRATPYWDMVAIRYLSHDSTNLTLGSPALTEAGVGLGIDVIEIDLGLLMLQFTLWMKEQLASEEEQVRNYQMFIGMHVLPKLKCTQYALALMNRLAAIAEGRSVNNQSFRLSRSFVDRSLVGQNVLEPLSKIILSRDVTFEYLIGSLPVPMVSSLGVVATLSDYLPTRQITWALVLARYNLLRYLFILARVDPTRASRFPLNDIRRTLNRLYNDNGLEQVFRGNALTEVQGKLDALMAVVTA